jgi:mRNA interferase RelE/StbE
VARLTVLFTRSSRKELEQLPPPLARRIVRRIEVLATNPRPPGCRVLTGADSLWRIRVGDYRVLYEIQDARATVDILAIRHRSEAYR